jgi:hypothetical protein
MTKARNPMMIERLKAEGADQEASFDLRWQADMRAIARWRAAGAGRELAMPDHADLCVWLLERLEEIDGEYLGTMAPGGTTQEQIASARAAITDAYIADGKPPQKVNWMYGAAILQYLRAEELGRELQEARRDTERLDWLIDQSNQGNGWLDDSVWDAIPAYADSDPKDAIRAAIDGAARSASPEQPSAQGQPASSLEGK